MKLTGIHHLTAVSANAKGNLAFYTGTLGMRLAKKTDNQDGISACHPFCADAKPAQPWISFANWPSRRAVLRRRR